MPRRPEMGTPSGGGETPPPAGSDSTARVSDGFPLWLASYRRDLRLGRGGMGVVYRYRDTRLDRLVAVKALPSERSGDPLWHKRFEEEAKALATLDHPNVGRIHHLHEQDGALFLVLEFVPGRTLAEVLRDGPMTIPDALELARQVAAAIAAGHAVKLIHRDLKPGNVMVTPKATAKLLDYGLARFLDPDASSAPADAATAARVDEGVAPAPAAGTPGYMSPEQIYGEPADGRADIFAFGCVLYECLAGRPAFAGRSRERRIANTLDGLVDLGGLPRELDDTVRDLIDRCLRVEAEHRPESMAAVLSALAPPGGAAQVTPRAERPNNLPGDVSTYVERPGERAEVGRLLARSRLLTITGPGGSGKTRLALEIARAAAARRLDGFDADAFAAGIWFAELRALQDPGIVTSVLLRALWRGTGETASPEELDVDAVAAALDRAPALLVVDNCEHLRSAAAGAVERLLRRLPDLRIIATSREALGTTGEQIHRMRALAWPGADEPADAARHPAVRLFLDRARLAKPDFALDATTAPLVATICRRLEGVPLAIELAAARLGTMPLPLVADRLFQVLDPRRILESSIESSVRLLEDAARALLGRLAVFRGGWTLEAAESVCAEDDSDTIGDQPVLALLGQLVESSLVQYEVRDDRARYHLLEPVRQYAEAQLLDGHSRAALERAHLGVYLRLAREADGHYDGPEQADWLDRLEIEHDNIRVALETALQDDDRDLAAQLARDMDLFWYLRGHLEEGRAALERAIARRSGVVDVLQQQLSNAAGIIALRQHDLDAAERHFNAALDVARRLDDTKRQAGVLTNLGMVLDRRDRLEEAAERHRASLALYESLKDEPGQAMVMLNLSNSLVKLDRLDEAEERLGRALPVLRQMGDEQRIAAALKQLGEIACRRGRYKEAAETLRQALQAHQSLGELRGIASEIFWLSVVQAGLDRPERAATMLGAALDLYRRARFSIPLADQRQIRHHEAALRQRLEAEIFETAIDRGVVLSVSDAFALAFEEPDAEIAGWADSASTLEIEACRRAGSSPTPAGSG